MSYLIKGATIVAMDKTHGADPFTGDILIVDDRIKEIGANLPDAGAGQTIDGRTKLVMPGLTNAHVHSWEAMFKGRYDNLPLELWMLLCYPILGAVPLPPRLVYLRTMIVGMECLKTGVTNVLDDVLEMPTQDLAQLEAVFQAYDDLGIRANVSGHIINRPFSETIPFTEEYLSEELQAEVAAMPPPSTQSFIDFAEEAVARFHNKKGRLRYVIAPSGPQRCTDDMLLAAYELADKHDMAYHIHILESKIQAVTGHEFYGKTLIGHMNDIGALGPRTTIAHSIWVTDEDIAMMADAGSTVVHNAISNQKLSVGIMPYRKLMDAGITIGLGSDGISTNDTPRIFDVMKAAALLHKISTPDYPQGPTASEILHAGTINGARTAMIDGDTGSLEAGKKADLLILDMKTLNFTPLNDVRNHLVYCENGTSIEKVMVNGEIVVEDNRLKRVDEAALLDELRGHLPEFKQQIERLEELNRVFRPAFEKIHKRCCGHDLGINRFARPPEDWYRR
jgi:cytosine/adenosine deaminase-related metal-dependent hydrolase